MDVRLNRITGFVTLGAGLLFLLEASSWSLENLLQIKDRVMFPTAVAIGLCATALLLIFGNSHAKDEPEKVESNEPSNAEPRSGFGILYFAAWTTGFAAYYLSLISLGFIPSSILACLGLMFAFGRRDPIRMIAIAVTASLLLYFLFGKVFGVAFP